MDEHDDVSFYSKQNFKRLKRLNLSSSSTSSDDRTNYFTKIKKRLAGSRCERSDNRAHIVQVEDQVNMKSGTSRLLTDFKTIRTIGKGAFGKVIEVKNNIDNCVYAVKCIKFNVTENPEKTMQEVHLLSNLTHDKIVRYIDFWIDEVEETTDSEGSGEDASYAMSDNAMWNCINVSPVYEDTIPVNKASQHGCIKILYIQMQLCYNTLADAIKNNLWKEHSKAWRIFWEIVEGLEYLHKKFVIHRDLKPHNIFLDANARVKIGDFGLATRMFRESMGEQVSQSLSGEVGTFYYRAPELNNAGRRTKYGQEVDLYSLGITLFEMFYPPFYSLHERHDVLTALRKEAILMPEEFLNDENNVVPIHLLRLLLKHDARERATVADLLSYHKNNQNTFQMNIMMQRNNPLQSTNAFYNKIPNTESKHAFGHSI